MMLFVFLFVICASTNYETYAATTVKRSAKGGQPHPTWCPWCAVKYDEVNVDRSSTEVNIKCRGGGAESCPTSLVSSGSGNQFSVPDMFYDDMIAHALSQIASNNLSGSYPANFIYNNVAYIRSVTWEADNAEDSEITVIISPL